MKRSAAALVLLSAFVPAIALAQEVGNAEASPKFFFLLEVAGVLIVLASIWFSKKAEHKFGGLIGTMLRTQTAALMLIAVALVIRAYSEITGAEGFFWDLAFELPVYAALLLIAKGSWKLAQGLDQAVRPSK